MWPRSITKATMHQTSSREGTREKREWGCTDGNAVAREGCAHFKWLSFRERVSDREIQQEFVLASRCCWLSQEWRTLMLYSDSIHRSLKARKRPSGEVITQEALLQSRDRRRLWGVVMADGAMWMSEQYQEQALRRGGGLRGSRALLWLILCQRTVTIFQCAETVNNARPLRSGTRGRGGEPFTWGVVERLWAY